MGVCLRDLLMRAIEERDMKLDACQVIRPSMSPRTVYGRVLGEREHARTLDFLMRAIEERGMKLDAFQVMLEF